MDTSENVEAFATLGTTTQIIENITYVFKSLSDDGNSSDFNFYNISESLTNESASTESTTTNPSDAIYTVTFQMYDILIPVMGAISIVLNLAVVTSSGLILKKGQQPRSTYLLLGNVAMTDFVTAISIIFGQTFPRKYRDHYICSVQIGMIVSSTLTSIISVGMIAVDRFLFILHGLQYQKWVYPERARMAICASWLIGGIVGFLPLFGWHGDTINGKKCWFILMAPKNLIVLTITIAGIPLLIVMVLYTIILFHAIKNIIKLQRAAMDHETSNTQTNENGLRAFRGRSNTSDSSENEANDDKVNDATRTKKKSLFKIFTRKPTTKVNEPSKWKAIKVVIFTSGSFLITWGPYFIASFVYAFEDVGSPSCKHLTALIASPLAILGFANTLINPVIYAWWHKGFRTFVKRRLNSFRRKQSRVDIATISKNTSSSTAAFKSSITSGRNNRDAIG